MSKVYIVPSLTALERLRELESAQCEAIIDDLYRELVPHGRPLRFSDPFQLYECQLGAYVAIYRELTRKEIACARVDHGYFLIDIRSGPEWLMDQLGG